MRIWGISTGVMLGLAACSSHDNAAQSASGNTGGTSAGGAGGAGAGGVGAGGVQAQGGASPQGGQGGGLCNLQAGPSWNDLKTTATKLYETDNILDQQIVDGGYFYFFERTKGIQRFPEQGGSPELILPTPGGDGNTGGTFFFSQTHLYYGTSEVTSTVPPALHRVPRDQWTATPEDMGGTLRTDLRAADGDSVLGYDQSANELWKQDFKTGASTVLASNVQVSGMALDGGYVYFTDDNFGFENVSRVPIAGGAKETVSNLHVSSLGAVGVFGQDVYWSANGTIYVTKIGDPTSTKELGHSGPGGFGYGSVFDFSLHGSRLYWQDDGANVGWTGLDGSTCGIVLSGVIIDAKFGTNDLFVSIFDFPNSLWRTPL